MGRGDRSTVRWRNERIRRKKARDKRKGEQKDDATPRPASSDQPGR